MGPDMAVQVMFPPELLLTKRALDMKVLMGHFMVAEGFAADINFGADLASKRLLSFMNTQVRFVRRLFLEFLKADGAF